MQKKDVTFTEKFSQLQLEAKHPKNKGFAFVLVEGESDIRLFRKLFCEDTCKVEAIPGGKIKVEECLQEFIPMFPKVIGIRDADFLHLKKQPYAKPNLFLTDFHDMEMMLIAEDEAFRSIIYEYASIHRERYSEIRIKIMQCIESISLLKWLNDQEILKINFSAGFQDLISQDDFQLDFDAYLEKVLPKSPNSTIVDPKSVVEKLELLKQSNPDAFQICNGHDFLEALSKFIRDGGKPIKDETLSSAFRIAYSFEMYKKTQLFEKTQAWANVNHCILYDQSPFNESASHPLTHTG